MTEILCIGDCLIDLVEQENGQTVRHPGGAALNLAVGAARLGLKAALAARIGQDRDGFRLARYLRAQGVRLIRTPNVDSTGLVHSRREGAEPVYHFSGSMFRRRIAFEPVLRQAIAQSGAVAVNSLSFDDRAQAAALVAALEEASGLIAVDPNPRANLIADCAAFRTGAEAAMRRAGLVKLGDEDARLLYGCDSGAVRDHLFGLGVPILFCTHGSAGASLHARGGLTVSVGLPPNGPKVVDTMGAGDAALAAVLAWILLRGRPDDAEGWTACLRQAVAIATATCARPGGALRLPETEP